MAINYYVFIDCMVNTYSKTKTGSKQEEKGQPQVFNSLIQRFFANSNFSMLAKVIFLYLKMAMQGHPIPECLDDYVLVYGCAEVYD